MKRIILFSLVILLVGISCKKDDSSSSKSDLFVKIVSYNNSSVEGATIVTIPATETVISDVYGTATISNIPVGTYDVYAILNGFGSGKKSVQIVENSGNDVEITIEYGNFPDFIPQIYVLEPDYLNGEYIFSSPDSVDFLVNVVNGTIGNQIIWVSDLDGEIGVSVIGDDMNSSISFEGLTDGEHTFTVTAKGDEGIDGYMEFSVKTNGPKGVHLYPLEVEAFNLRLTWSYYDGDNFDNYSIIRRIEYDDGGYSETTMNSLYGEWDTTTTVQIENENNCKYFIRVITDDYYSNTKSNIRLFAKGYFGESFNSSCRDMVLHKFKNLVYFIYSGEIILYDYESRVIIATRSISSIQDHYDIRYNGENAVLYFASDFRVYILNGEDLSLVEAINFPNTVYSVSSISSDIIFASVDDDNYNSSIYSYSTNQNKIVDSIITTEMGDLYLNRAPENNKIVVFCDSYGYSMKYLNYDSNGAIIGLDETSATGNYYYENYPFSFSPNNEYFIPIRASSKVYRTDDNISEDGILSNNYDFKDITYSPNSDTIFGLPSSNGSWFVTYTYPDLELIDEVETECNFAFSQRKGNTFYGLMAGSSGYGSKYYFIEGKPK